MLVSDKVSWVGRVEPGVIDVVLSYCHYCLSDTSLESILPYLESKGVGVINASILSMGLLTEQVGTPPRAVLMFDFVWHISRYL